MSRYKKSAREEMDDGLLVFGYSSRIYTNDSRSELIAGESHLQPWPMDEEALIDRFDVRLLLSTKPSEVRGRVEWSTEEEGIERECEDERWKDLHEAEFASLKRMEEEESRPKKAEYSFSYDQPSGPLPSSSLVKVEEEDDDSEDEPFVSPPGIKLPVGLETPDNQKLNHVIERTALFVVKQGPQMEIVIKAKQKNNQEQFGFLHFDHLLNPYYKYIMKLIREGKYAPNLESKKKKKSVVREETRDDKENGKMGGKANSSNALTALMAQHGSDSEDSDSDYELHPSLLAASRRGGSPDPVEKGEKAFSGPLKKPKTPPPMVTRTDYSIETANDAYSTLFKNLAQINVAREKEKEEEVEKKREKIEERPIDIDEESEESKKEWDDFTQWFISFYGMSPPIPFCNLPYIPPPPDMEKALSGYARYVGENGAEAEFALKGRVELQLHFLAPSNPHHLYYLSAVRRAQWEKSQKDEKEVMTNSVLAPPPPLNRKQRRQAFQDAPQLSSAPLPSVLDPATLVLAAAAHSYESPMVRSVSSPGLSTVYSSPSYASPHHHALSPAPPPPLPPTFGLGEGSKKGIIDGNSLTLQPCPVPPNIGMMAGSSQIAGNEIMSERQLKARLFMEKIMNDKRKKKEEDAVKMVDGMEEGEILESEEKERRRRGRKEEEKEERREKKGGKDGEEKKKVSTSFIDNLIKSKMDALLKETVPGSLAVEKKNEEIKEEKEKEEREKKKEERREKEKKEERREKGERREKEREERKRKREKKEKRKRRSLSRSSSSGEEERRRRRRSRSRSSDIPSKYRRR